MPKSTACDRCHRHKERCIFTPPATVCQLCAQAKATCTTTRARPRRGRKPQTKAYDNGAALAVFDAAVLDVGLSPAEQPSLNRSLQDPLPPDATLAETVYKAVFKSKPQQSSPQLTRDFYTAFDCFLLGPTFAGPLRIAAQKAFFCAPALLEDIYPAIEVAVRDARSEVALPDMLNVTRGTMSLQKLRTIEINDSGTALGLLVLGQVLMAFDLLTNVTGSRLIHRYAMASVAPWYEELAQDPSLDAVATTSVFWDVACSLVRSEIPVLKPCIRPDRSVDRLAGLCTTMLPLQYDLAVAINKIKVQREAGHSPDLDLLESIEHHLHTWTPSHPADFYTAYSVAEQLRMTAQAALHRTGALLCAERARSPFGDVDGDARARKLATTILADFARYASLLDDAVHFDHPEEGDDDNDCPTAAAAAGGRGRGYRAERLRHVGCPLLAAALEVPDIAATPIVHDIDLLTVAPTCRAQVCAFVDYVWRRRNGGFRGFLCELVRDGPEFTPVP